MINTTDRPIVINHSLDRPIRDALQAADSISRAQSKAERKPRSSYASFSSFFGPSNQKDEPFDEVFLQAAFDFTLSDSTNISAKTAMATMARYVMERNAPATGFPSIKRGLKLALVELWRQRVVVLPTIFTPASRFAWSAFRHELLGWLKSFDPESRAGERLDDMRRLYNYGPRILLATDWRVVEDVSLNEIATLHRACILYARGAHPYAIPGMKFPWSQLPAELLKAFPNRVLFNKPDLEKYSAWSAMQAIARVDLDHFNVGQTVRDSPRKRLRLKATRPLVLTTEPTEGSTHEAILSLFKRLSNRVVSLDWRRQTPVYPGREHIDVGAISPVWTNTFNAFLHHREHIQGYRSSDSVVASLNILADYLFLYLPWWKELYPQSSVLLPLAPKDFARYAFASRHIEEPIESLPAPLLRLIRLRRAANESASQCIKHLTLYFRFVGAHFGNDESVAGSTFRNPIDDEFDAPRLIGKRNKTNKHIIPRHIYGYLLFYCYAIEDFGQHLLAQALNGALPAGRSVHSERRFDASQFGAEVVVKHRGKEYQVRSVPNVFTWVEREVRMSGDSRIVRIPHASTLRLLIVALETGLRCQSIQWLDRATWDSANQGSGDQYTYKLHINTDKTKAHSWDAPVVFRVRNALQREANFQQMFSDADSYEPVPYEGLTSSPFPPITPLFRAPTSGRPISDTAYSEMWVSVCIDFESFFKEISGERHVRMFHIKPQQTPDGHPVVKYAGRNGDAYCGLSILAVHTPHSCRATFATNRQGQGILELTDVAALLGHESVTTTAHYTKYSSEQLQERLQQSDVSLVGDFSQFNPGEDGPHIRADKAESALVQSFARNREQTVAAFKFMPSISLWSIEDQRPAGCDGLTLLRNGPMSHIRFRETHICPVGEECPADVVQQIGAPKRCGVCPLAMKCIDHLPAIGAKRNQLLERIRFLHNQRVQMEAANEPSSSLDAIWDEVQLDINELLGWKFSEDTLARLLINAGTETESEPTAYYQVERPDIVRRHLRLVSRKSDKAEFLLQRLAECNAYPSLTSPQVQLAASVLRRRLSAGQRLDDLASDVEPNDDVRAVASMLGNMMKVCGLSIEEVAELLVAPDSFQLESSARVEEDSDEQ